MNIFKANIIGHIEITMSLGAKNNVFNKIKPFLCRMVFV